MTLGIVGTSTGACLSTGLSHSACAAGFTEGAESVCVTDGGAPFYYLLTSEKVHLKVRISSAPAGRESPEFNLISHMSSLSHDCEKCPNPPQKPGGLHCAAGLLDN